MFLCLAFMKDYTSLLTLLQLASPALPVGAYSYSEGIETLAAQGTIATSTNLLHWLSQELAWGGIRVETAVMGWVYKAAAQQDFSTVEYWNQWLSAFREPEEMRSQSWQMGRSLLRLFADLEPALADGLPMSVRADNCNYAIAYALVSHAWGVPSSEAGLAYLQSWAANLISAAVRAVPLGQTEGQRILRQLATPIEAALVDVQTMTEADLAACSWGVSLASMQHETLYSRLFRS
jgi:urease accessory protein